jgi:hypothetical protein
MPRAKKTATASEPERYRCVESYCVVIDNADVIVRRGDVLAADNPALRAEFCIAFDATTRDERRHRVAHGLVH